jgi:pimeloyl-ACP methyl ester carboxylesterase
MSHFAYDGHRLVYTEYGDGDRVVVLLHGLLLSQRMHERLARALARRGHRVITLDLLGHGASDRPRDMGHYSMTLFGEQLIALLDHLELQRAVVLGTSLGANVALEAAVAAPERLQGMVIEMPVLDNALAASVATFGPMLGLMTIAELPLRLVARVARAIPDPGYPWGAQVALDWIRQEPGPSAAVLEGIIFGRTAPHRKARRLIATPSLVIGHPRDPVHPFSDAGMLAEELPNGRLLEADSILELRVRPKRLLGEIAGFIDECWSAGASLSLVQDAAG